MEIPVKEDPIYKDDRCLDQRLPWKKVLYMKQSYPDNHVPDTFLTCLVTNPSLPLKRRSISKLMFFTLPILLRVAMVMILISVYFGLSQESIDQSTSLDPPFTCPHTVATYPFWGPTGYSYMVAFLCEITEGVEKASSLSILIISFTILWFVIVSWLILLYLYNSTLVNHTSFLALIRTYTLYLYYASKESLLQIFSKHMFTSTSAFVLFKLMIKCVIFVSFISLSPSVLYSTALSLLVLHLLFADYSDTFAKSTPSLGYIHVHTHMSKEKVLQRCDLALYITTLQNVRKRERDRSVKVNQDKNNNIKESEVSEKSDSNSCQNNLHNLECKETFNTVDGVYSENMSGVIDTNGINNNISISMNNGVHISESIGGLTLRKEVQSPYLSSPLSTLSSPSSYSPYSSNLLADGSDQTMSLLVSEDDVIMSSFKADFISSKAESIKRNQHFHPHACSPLSQHPHSNNSLVKSSPDVVDEFTSPTSPLSPLVSQTGKDKNHSNNTSVVNFSTDRSLSFLRLPSLYPFNFSQKCLLLAVLILLPNIHPVSNSLLKGWDKYYSLSFASSFFSLDRMILVFCTCVGSIVLQLVPMLGTVYRQCKTEETLDLQDKRDKTMLDAMRRSKPNASLSHPHSHCDENTCVDPCESHRHFHMGLWAYFVKFCVKAVLCILFTVCSKSSKSITAPSLKQNPFLFSISFLSSIVCPTCGVVTLSFVSAPISRRLKRTYLFIALTLLTLTWVIVVAHSPVLSYIYLLLLLLIGVIAPYLFLYLQRDKLQLHGPWDYDDAGEKGRSNI